MAATSSKALFEFIDNPESRSPILLVLDCSKGMDGAPLKAFAAGLAAFRETVIADRKAVLRVELAVAAVGDGARLVRPFATLDDDIEARLSAGGRRDLGAGLDLAVDAIDQRKAAYNAHGIKYRRPWVFLVSGGAPDDRAPWDAAAQRLLRLQTQRKASVMAVGVAGLGDLKPLSAAVPPARPPLALETRHLDEFFAWLGPTVCKISVSRTAGEMMLLPLARGWARAAV